MRNLPPFVLLACLVGLVAGADAVPPSSTGPDAANAAAEACSNIRVKSPDYDSGPFNSENRGDVNPKDVRLRITVEPPPEAGQRPIIVIEQHIQQDEKNRILWTLIAALLIVALAVGVALAVQRQRRRRAAG